MVNQRSRKILSKFKTVKLWIEPCRSLHKSSFAQSLGEPWHLNSYNNEGTEGRKEERKEGMKEGRNEGRNEGRKEGKKEGGKEGRRGVRREGRKEGRNERTNERTKEGRNKWCKRTNAQTNNEKSWCLYQKITNDELGTFHFSSHYVVNKLGKLSAIVSELVVTM